MNEWGLPDWTDEAAYGDTSEWTVFRWRWEFYRRRDDLRNDFDTFKDKHYQYCCEVALSLDGTSDGILKPDNKNFTVAVLNCPEKYGYTAIPNPRFGDLSLRHIFPHGDREDDMSVVLGGLGGKTSRNVRVSEKTHGFVFKLEKPIGPQLEKAKEDLERMQVAVTGKKRS